jgi:ABC-type transport system involved in multi-copper enzyme maturation permease subunit
MKYLALLRDSFREALDSKVIYFTFGLSALLVLFLLSVSFRPITARDQAEQVCSVMNWASGLETTGKPGRKPFEFDVTEFNRPDDALPPWEGDYRIVVTMYTPGPLVGSQEAAEKKKLLYRDLYVRFFWLDHLNIREEVRKSDKIAPKEAEPKPGDPQKKDAEKKEDQFVDFVITGHGSATIKDMKHWYHEPSLFFGLLPLSFFQIPLTTAVNWIEDVLVNGMGGWVILLLGVVISASFIPNMLQKGSLDLLLVKPIPRLGLLLTKYLGGLIFVFINSVIAIGGVWLVLGLRTGIWTYGFLLVILAITFFFAILYAVSVLFGVLTRSTVLCIFMTCVVWFLLFLVGMVDSILNPRQPEIQTAMEQGPPAATAQSGGPAETDPALKGVANIVHVVHTILPRTDELGQLTSYLIRHELISGQEGQSVLVWKDWHRWVETLGVSLAFIAVMLGLACWRFVAQDY